MSDKKKTAEKTVTLKVERDLADAFKRAAKANDRSQSLLIRDFMKDYVNRPLAKVAKGIKIGRHS